MHMTDEQMVNHVLCLGTVKTAEFIQNLLIRIAALEVDLDARKNGMAPKDATTGMCYAVEKFNQQVSIGWIDDWCIPEIVWVDVNSDTIETEDIKRVFPLMPNKLPEGEE